MERLKEFTANWNRSIMIDSPIDDDLVKKLMPRILTLRQESTDPITVGINSPGGSLAALDVLLGLLKGPGQNGTYGEIITVVTHRAYSAAANFLAFGDYSVALKHAQVLYHDVRFGGMEDVTPEKARGAAKLLQERNDEFAMRLANTVIERLVWIYIDLSTEFDNDSSANQEMYEDYTSIINDYAPQVEGFERVDIAGFAVSLWKRLSKANDNLITNVMGRLRQWVYLTEVVKKIGTYRQKGSRTPGLLDGVSDLNKKFSGNKEHFESCEDDLKLLLTLVVDAISKTKTAGINFQFILDKAVREFGILDSMNDKKHIKYALKLMLENDFVFFGNKIDDQLENMGESEKLDLFRKCAPSARLFWHFCVLLCRELFEGEHILSPEDAQLLGLVDEVSGGGPIQSRREYHLEKMEKEQPREEQPKP